MADSPLTDHLMDNAGPVASRPRKSWGLASVPGVSDAVRRARGAGTARAYSALEHYQAFTPERNVGDPSVDNAPVLRRGQALLLDLAIYSAVFLVAMVTLLLVTNPWWLFAALTYPVGFYA